MECRLVQSVESGGARGFNYVASSIGLLQETPQYTLIRKMMSNRQCIATVTSASNEDTSRFRPVSGGAGLARSLVGGRAFFIARIVIEPGLLYHFNLASGPADWRLARRVSPTSSRTQVRR